MLELIGLEDLDQQLSDLFSSDAFQLVTYVVLSYIVLIWLASAFWAYRDMRLRSASAITPYVAAASIIAFTPIFFLFGLLIYRIVRPKETIAEVNERAIAEEAMLAEIASHAHCANCSRPVHEDWIICPTCRNRLRRVCPNCEHLIELDWTLCAWCGRDFERAEAAGTAAYMPSARPAPPRQQAPVRVPAPPPPARQVAPAVQPTRPAESRTATPAPTMPAAQSSPQTQPSPPTQPQSATATGTQPASGVQPTTGI